MRTSCAAAVLVLCIPLAGLGCKSDGVPFGGDGGIAAVDGGSPSDGGADGGAATDGGPDGGLPADGGLAGQGEPCQLTASCAAGLFCGLGRTCEPDGNAAAGERCTTTADCQASLVCNPEGLIARCRAAGSGGLGAGCNLTTDCLAGLLCLPVSGGSQCVSPPALDGGTAGAFPPIPPWSGSTCAEDTGPARAYLDVPRAGSDADFYRLPFPNDVRRSASGLDLSGHPHPGAVLPVDVLGRVLEAAQEDLRGFATNPVIFFRFSQRYSWDSVSGDTIKFVDVTVGSPTYGAIFDYAWVVTYGTLSRYICPDFIALRRSHGVPLRPGTTYAVLLTTGIVPEAGGTFARSPDLDALLASAPPGDAALTAAHAAYAPLREWLTASGTDPASILNATVFTTQDPEDLASRLRVAVRATALPAVSDLTLCDTGGTSPCDDGTPLRACGAPDPAFAEIHGRIALPIFQAGTPPYAEPAQGGGIQRDGNGDPQVVRTEPVCFALTVPRDVAAPTEGFPLLLYAHGTGGSFTGAVRDGLAAAVSEGMAGATSVRAATLAIDLPVHGARRGGSTLPPEELFFNYGNPRAARGNVAQGAADLMTLVYWAAGYSLDAGASPSGQAIRFDASRIALFAHSQGATHASVALPFEPEVRGVVLSGNGGDLSQALLHKTRPFDIAAALPYALLDGTVGTSGRPELALGEYSPALALIQAYFEPVDPVNFGRRLRIEPLPGDTGHHVFMTYGLGDSYSPAPTLQAFANASRLVLVRPALEAFGLEEADAPLTGNVTVGAQARTQGLRQYAPNAGDDGHFVSTATEAGRADTLRFLLETLAGQTPSIGAP